MTDIEITSDELDKMMEEASKPKRIAKSTGKPDKRTITSKINARKAGQAKLAKLRAPPLQIIEDEMSDDSSSDDDNVLILKQRSNKNKKVATKRTAMPTQPDSELFNLKNDIEQMKQLMQGLAKKKQKTKIIKVAAPVPPIQVPPPVAVPVVPQTDIIADHMKKKLLNF
jgi:hypothetical protein